MKVALMPEVQNAATTPVIHFGGMRFNPLTVPQALAVLASRDPKAPFSPYVTPNVEHAYLRHRHADMDEASEAAVLSTNDSRVLLKLARLAGLELEFAPGAYIVPALFESTIKPDDPLSIIGGRPELAQAIREKFGLTNLVQHIPPMGLMQNEGAIAETVAFIAAHPSRFVFVSMGPPQSEQLCLRVMRDGRASGIGLCVGSSLAVLIGEVNAAPDWMERHSLVWLHRLAREPRRLWRRYLVRGMYGVWLCLKDIIAIRLGGRRAVA